MRIQFMVYVHMPMMTFSQSLDEAVNGYFSGKGFENAGGGFGLGGRDLEYVMPNPLDQTAINLIARELRVLTGNSELEVFQDGWNEDDADAEGSIQEYSLEAS